MVIAVVCGLIGAALPLLLPAGMMRSYTSESRLEIKAEAGSSASRAAVVAAAARKLRDPDHLDRIIRAMDLAGDPEFAGAMPSTWRFLSELVSRRELTVAAAELELRERISNALDIVPEEGGTAVTVRARSTRADRAAQLANVAMQELQRELNAESAGQDGDAVVAARSALEAAQSALDADGSDEGALAAMRRAQAEKRILDEDKARLDQRLTSLADQVAAASDLNPTDIVVKGLPDVLAGSGLDLARRKRMDAKLLLDQLSVDLGPRHPRFIAAKGALDDADAGIERAMKALIAGLKQQEAALDQEKQALDSKLKALAAKPVSEAMRKRAELEAAVDTARKAYLGVLRHEETAGRAMSVSSAVTVPARAQTALVRGYPFWVYSLWGGLVGMFGALFVLLTQARQIAAPSADFDRVEPVAVAVAPRAIAAPVMAATMVPSLARTALPADDGAKYEPIHLPEPDAPTTGLKRAAVVRASASPPLVAEMEQRVMANDLPLTAQINAVLMSHRQPSKELDTALPSLLAAILNRDMVPDTLPQSAPYVAPSPSLPLVDPEELRNLQSELQRLRLELSHYERQDHAA